MNERVEMHIESYFHSREKEWLKMTILHKTVKSYNHLKSALKPWQPIERDTLCTVNISLHAGKIISPWTVWS